MLSITLNQNWTAQMLENQKDATGAMDDPFSPFLLTSIQLPPPLNTITSLCPHTRCLLLQGTSSLRLLTCIHTALYIHDWGRSWKKYTFEWRNSKLKTDKLAEQNGLSGAPIGSSYPRLLKLPVKTSPVKVSRTKKGYRVYFLPTGH